MKISVFGIGYVGAVSAACLCRDSHCVVAVDPNAAKVRALLKGRSPIIEPGLEPLIKQAVAQGVLTADTDPFRAVQDTDLSFVCVGTPSLHNGNLETGYVERVSEELGAAIKDKNGYHSVVVRSTILPGTMEDLVIAKLEAASGKRAGRDFGVAYYPEFLREGTAVSDYDEPGAVIYGRLDDITIERLKEVNAQLPTAPTVVDIRVAEAVKYTNNAWHAVKISFSNEIGNVCKAMDIDSHLVLDILCSDNRLNISRAYMRPGFAFGGSCLPKDLRAFRHRAKQLDVDTPLLNATLEANELQIRKAYDIVARTGKRRVGFIGLSFKPDTDDLRESPLLELAERLYGKGYDIRVFDPNVRYAALTGANREFVRQRLPHLTDLLVGDIDMVCDHAEVLVVGKRDDLAADACRRVNGSKMIVDLARISPQSRSNGSYQGICW